MRSLYSWSTSAANSSLAPSHVGTVPCVTAVAPPPLLPRRARSGDEGAGGDIDAAPAGRGLAGDCYGQLDVKDRPIDHSGRRDRSQHRGLDAPTGTPYPFILLNLALSFQAAYAAPIIMMSQNRQAAKDRLIAEQATWSTPRPRRK
jgi:hypothetical protein